MYRPGEVAYVKGWVRRVDLSPQGDVSFAGKKGDSIAWNLMDSRGNEVAKGTSELSALGGFDLKIDLPKTMNLGHARLRLSGGSGAYNHTLKVQEFRRPEFEVNAKVTEGPHQLGTTATVTVNAAYFAGGGLGSAPTNWSGYATPAWFTPPNRAASMRRETG